MRSRFWTSLTTFALSGFLMTHESAAQATPAEPPQPVVAAAGGALRLEPFGRDVTASVGSDVNQTYAVVNPGSAAVSVRFGQLSSGGAPTKTAWRRFGELEEFTTPQTIPGKGRLVVLVQAKAPKPGIYMAPLQLLDAAGKPTGDAVALVLDRRGDLPASGVLVPPNAPTAVTLGFEPVALELRVDNPTAAPITLNAPIILDAKRTVSGRIERVKLDATEAGIRCEDAAEAPSVPVTLAPHQSCRATLSLASPGPGVFDVVAGVNGADGGSASTAVQFTVRRSWWVAFGVAAVGALLGGFVRWWRDHGRPVALALAEAARLMDRIRRADRAARDLGLDRPREIIAEIRLLQADMRSGDKTDWSANLQGIAQRLDLLDGWLNAEKAIKANSLQSPELENARTALRAQILDPHVANEQLSPLLEALRTALAAPAAGGVTLAVPMPAGLAAPTAAKDDFAWEKRQTDRRRTDLVVALIVGVIGCLSTAQLAWGGSSSWGTLADMLTLFISATALQTGAQAAAQTLTNPATA